MTSQEPVPPVRILIVDDEAAQMKALCDTLCEYGYETVGYTSGKSALASMESGKFALLLSDLMMPEMDGIMLLQAVSKIDPNIVGVIMTGEGTIPTAVEAMKVGALDYILKPFKLSIILPILSRALAIRQLRIDNVRLQLSIRQRTAELEVANKELETFSYSVSHDLRSPLRAISGFMHCLEENMAGKIDAEGRDYLDRVLQAAKRMEELIDDLLNLSRVTRAELNRNPIDLSAIANQVVNTLRQADPTRSIDVVVNSGLQTTGDSRLLRIVLSNLLGNAWKFTSKQPQAQITVGSDVDETGARIFFIRDNGAGFDMARASKLFQPFQRLHGMQEFPGTGIGLATVHRIIHRHGGRIWTKSAINEGTTFYFTLT